MTYCLADLGCSHLPRRPILYLQLGKQHIDMAVSAVHNSVKDGILVLPHVFAHAANPTVFVSFRSYNEVATLTVTSWQRHRDDGYSLH